MIHNISRFIAALAIILLTAQTAGATETSTITVGGTDYTLFTGFTATDGNGTGYANLVDGNTSTDWMAEKTSSGEPDPDPDAPPALTGDFAGGTDDPAFVEFHADEPIVPKGYVLTCHDEDAGFWKPVQWALKAKLNEGGGWTTIQSSTTTLGQGKTFQIPCTNDGNNEYQYFRFEVYEVGTTDALRLDELQFYGSLPAYTHLTVKAATCMATGIKQDCYRRNSDGKYFTDNTGETEIPESDVIAPMIPHTGEHHEATDVNIEYWQCSMCGKYFSDSGYTTEITEEQTKIYRTITIDGSISGLVTCYVSQVLAGATVYLYVSDLIDASTLKVNNGAVELTAENDIRYSFTMPAADVTVTAEVAQSNADGDVLTGSVRHTVTITNGANITLSNATITGSIVCEGSATITLVGTNSVSGASQKAGIQIGGSGTTLTIKGDGSLTANGGDQSAGIGLSRIWNYDSNVTSGDIVIEGGTITATGGHWGAGIGTGIIKSTNNDNSTSVQFGNVTIKGGTVTATGGDSGDGIGKGYSYPGPAITFGTVTIYDGIDKVDASSIKDFGSVVYMSGESNVTASKADHFTIIENGDRRIIVKKFTPTIADVPDQTYTGSEITPEPLVLASSLSLTKGTDYVYSYTNNTNVGTATVTVTFQGDYAWLGSVEKEFTIVWSETDTDEYTIHNAAEWNVFCDCLNDNDTYNRFSGKTVRLGDNITVTRMAGGSNHAFTGTFDGQGHTLTLAYGTADEPIDAQFVAPFVEVTGGATFRNLTIAGTIYDGYTASGEHNIGGLIGHLFGTVTIEHCTSLVEIHAKVGAGGFVGLCEHNVSFNDCHSAAVIRSADGSNSGFVAWSRASAYTIAFTGCLFDGKLLQQNGSGSYNGGFIGWTGATKTVTITNSLCAPAPLADGETMASSNSATFARGWNATTKATNSYYTAALGDAQGKATRTVTAGTDVTIGAIALTGTATQYTVSGITAYSGGGLQRGETLYYGSDDQLSLTLTTSAQCDQPGYQYGYTASAGTLSGTTLTMPDQDVTISVNTDVLAPIDWATVNQGNSTDPYMIYNKDQLLLLAHRVNGTNGETANEYSGKFFKLGADITFSHDADEGDNYAENYEAIGGYYNSTYRYFKGNFDGANHTVSGIRIRKDGSGIDYIYQGLFGRIDSGADIHDVHLTDARIKGYNSVGGIVGYNYGTVSGCSVTDSYITATDNLNYGTICGWNGGTLTNNYYHGCTVNETAVTTGVGCHEADLADNHGALPAYRLALGENITTPPGTFADQTEWLDTPPVSARLAPENGFTLTGNHYFASGYEFTPGSTLASGAAQGYTPRATLGGELLDPYTPTGDDDALAGTAIAQFTVNADCDGKTLASTEAIYSTGLPVTVAYINTDGTPGEASAIALDGTETSLAEGWYFVGQPTVAFDHTLNLGGDVHLILVDGKSMKVRISKKGDGIFADGHNLHFYGQTEGTGALNAQTNDKFSVVIRITNGTLGIHGGNVNANAKSTVSVESAIRVERTTAGDALVIDRGTLIATANSNSSCGIYIDGGDVRINGGQVTATGEELGIDISDYEDEDDESLTIPGILTLSGGTLTASSFDTWSGESCAGTLAIAPGLTYTDGTSLYDSATETATLAALGGKTLQPCLALADAADNTAAITDHSGQALAVALSGRTLYKDGSWNTLCLPFAVEDFNGTIFADAKVMTLGNSQACNTGFDPATGTLNLDFVEADKIEPGVPYIVKWTRPDDYEGHESDYDISSPTFTGVTVENESPADHAILSQDNYVQFIGTYSPAAIYTADKTNLYLGAANTLYYPTTESFKVNAHRAYFQLLNGLTAGEPSSANAVRAFVLNFGNAGDPARIIPAVTAGEGARAPHAWFTLDGRRLDKQPTAKGIYVNNGRKVVIK